MEDIFLERFVDLKFELFFSDTSIAMKYSLDERDESENDKYNDGISYYIWSSCLECVYQFPYKIWSKCRNDIRNDEKREYDNNHILFVRILSVLSEEVNVGIGFH